MISIILVSIIFGLVTYYDYAKLTTPINGIPIERYCDQFQNPFCTERPMDLNFFEYVQYRITGDLNSNKYTTVFDEGSPLEEIGTGDAVLTKDNCNRYAYWLTKYQKDKVDRYEDYPRYPPWGNAIFPLVNYCLEVGDLIKTGNGKDTQWRFQLNEN